MMTRRTTASMIVLSSLLGCHPIRAFRSALYQSSRQNHRSCQARSISTTASSSSVLSSSVSETDEKFLQEAINHARLGLGHTFPNPAVGCVLVNQDTNDVVGAGFHPKAGFPHAEVFALLEAAGHVESGVEAAKSVVNGDDDAEGGGAIRTLTAKYAAEGGPEELFGNSLKEFPITAYVTLEPCCHYGQTPPCAASLALSKVDRVVVGFRDPNPRVDGGGVKILQDSGIQVDMAGGDINRACSDLVTGFVNRITPRDNRDLSWINGAMRSALRSLAGTRKANGDLAQVSWNGRNKVKGDQEEGVDALELDPSWLENLDGLLWEHEVVNMRLNRAVSKKKLARRLGERIAVQLDAHVAQSVGHTALLYRPGIPPVLDLQELVERSTKGKEEKQQETSSSE